MHPVSRLEIIVSSKEIEKITSILETVNVPGYSIIRDVIGKSNSETVSDDVNLGSSKLNNVFIICYCSQEQVKPIVEKVKPILNKYGGVCYLFEAMEISSVRCVAS
ncbi:MAG: P-II family nitrogen regulator [Waterburya sp.]